ncbi:MAG: hypothetical protein JW795_08520 [Chitinivibrionales bacterium]|nr:hypothetical protein [Chitinivibrionales bacterium]
MTDNSQTKNLEQNGESETADPFLRLMRRMFPWKDFFFGTIVPVALFYSFNRAGYTIAGILLSIGWSAVLVSAGIVVRRTIELFAAFGLTVTLIELLTTLITKSTTFYLASASLDHFLYGVVFLVSLTFKKPLIQMFAEAAPGRAIGTQRLRDSPDYRKVWVLLTVFWGVAKVFVAGLLLICQMNLSLETFLVVRTMMGMPLLVVLLVLSYWFPGWYWCRGKGSNSESLR